MVNDKQRKPREGVLAMAVQRAFLAHLAQSANVSASARAAGITASRAYAFRDRSPEFREKWHAALCEGYARLEAKLLAEALATPAGNIRDSTFRQKQMKVRLGMALLAAHRATVRGDARQSPSHRRDPIEVRSRLEARFATMRKRIGDASAPAE